MTRKNDLPVNDFQNFDLHDGAKRLCVVIGVSEPEDRVPLPGAIAAAHSIYKWAIAQGYDTRIITDEHRIDVTCARIKGELQPLLDNPGCAIQRIVIAFAGHGALQYSKDLWLLTKWRTHGEIVSLEGFVRRLATYSPAQVAIISDACRSPYQDDPELDMRSVIEPAKWAPNEPETDYFRATRQHNAAYMVPGSESRPSYCLFTNVLAKALWGKYAGSIDGRRIEGPAVTSQTLKSVLRRELIVAANAFNYTQHPDIKVDFTVPNDVYTLLDNGQPTAPREAFFETDPVSDKLIFEPEPSPRDLELVSQVDRRIQAMFSAQESIWEDRPAFHSGVIVVGDIIKSVAVAATVNVEKPRGNRRDLNSLHYSSAHIEGKAKSMAIELERSGLWICAAFYPEMLGVFTTDCFGATSLIYRSKLAGCHSVMAAARGIAAMDSGEIVNEEALDLALLIREFKHADPVIGVIASYLYARASDYESIRKIAWFYCSRDQPIPFDIALLGNLKLTWRRGLLLGEIPATKQRRARTEAEARNSFVTLPTPPSEGVIAGGIPWLRQGWSALQDCKQSALSQIRRFRADLAPSLFTTLRPSSGEELGQLIHEGRV